MIRDGHIAVEAQVAVGTISEFKKYGFDDVLLKPWTTAQLNAALARIPA